MTFIYSKGASTSVFLSRVTGNERFFKTTFRTSPSLRFEVGRRWAWREKIVKERLLPIEWDKQNKHILGSHSFNPIKGTIELPKNTFQELVFDRLGSRQKVVGTPGMPGYKERVDFDQIIGKYARILDNGKVEKVETTKGIIVYSKKGVHVFPSDPEAILK